MRTHRIEMTETLMRAATEVQATHLITREQVGRLALQRDLAHRKHIGAVRNAQSLGRILFHHQDSDALGIPQFDNRVEDFP